MDHCRYHSLNTYFRKTFGEKVYKISLAGGFTCPVRDGSISTGGCSYCNPLGNVPGHYSPGMTLAEQLKVSTGYVRKRHRANRFIAYFQDYTATYADPGLLESLYREAIAYPGVVGLAVCTRPDSIGEGVPDLLEELSRETFVWVELGVQSGCDVTLLRMNRGHTVYDSERAFQELHQRGILTSAHVILGFPGESREEALTTAELIRTTGTCGVKLQNLHVLRDTPLAEEYGAGRVRLMDMETYASLTADFIERIPPEVVIQRVAGEAPPGMLVAPDWAGNKMAVMNRVSAELVERDSWQGKLLGYGLPDVPCSR